MPSLRGGFTHVRRQLYCSAACKQAAFRRRQPTPGPGPPPPGPSRRHASLCQRDDCDQRYLGNQWCRDCNRPCRRLAYGGACPSCDEPINVSELLGKHQPESPGRPGTHHRQPRHATPLDKQESIAGSQYTSVRFAESLLLAGMAPSVGSAGDAYDNALAETTIGLYKAECVRDGSPFRDGPLRTLADIEKITAAWVHWYNTSRLMHRTGLRPPAEADASYWRSHPA